MTKQTKQMREYLKQVRCMLPCAAAFKKQILVNLRNDISGYMQEHPDADMENLVEAFGTPEQIAEAYIDTLSTTELAMKIRKRTKLWRTILVVSGACVLACVLIWGCAVIAALQEVENRGALIIETQIVEG